MGQTRITKDQYEILVSEFRKDPKNAKGAARAANVDTRTARRAYLTGWSRPTWARPIVDVIEAEQRQVRAKLAVLEEKKILERRDLHQDRQLAEYDAVTERAKEAQAVRASMSNAMTGLAVVGSFSDAAIKVARESARQVILKIEAGDLSWVDGLPILTRFVTMADRVNRVLRTSMEAARLHTGEPEKFVSLETRTKVDGSKAVAALGENDLKQAIMDLCEGNLSSEARRFLAWQSEENGGEVH